MCVTHLSPAVSLPSALPAATSPRTGVLFFFLGKQISCQIHPWALIGVTTSATSIAVSLMVSWHRTSPKSWGDFMLLLYSLIVCFMPRNGCCSFVMDPGQGALGLVQTLFLSRVLRLWCGPGHYIVPFIGLGFLLA